MNQFRLPYHLTVAEDVFKNIPEAMSDVMPKLSGRKTVIVTEGNLKELFADIIEEICKDFPDSEIFLIKDGSYDGAVALAKYITMNGFGTVIGFGGGTVLDMAKFAAYVSKTTLISLVTTLSNDSLASPVAVLGTEGKARKTFKCGIPDAILVDVNVIKSAPERQILAGIGDTVSKYTALYDWKLAGEKAGEEINDFAYMISEMAFDAIRISRKEDLKSTEFITRLTQALVMGGLAMEIAGSSKPSSGSEHLFCHGLEENYSEQVNVAHGIAVAMGSYGAAVFQGRDTALITRMIRDYGIPVKPSSQNVTEEIFIGAWQKAAASRPDRYSILNETDLSTERLAKLYEDMENIF